MVKEAIVSESAGAKPNRRRPTPPGDVPVLTGRVEAPTELERKPSPAKTRVVGDAEGERLTTEEWRERLAGNLDRLIGLIGLSRKEAADRIGVSYPLVRRLVSAGVSRAEERNSADLVKIAHYFTLPTPDDLWRADLIRTVLDPVQGESFIERFRPSLIGEWIRRMDLAKRTTDNDLALLGRALGIETPDRPPLSGPYAEKVAAILSSPKADTFKSIIDDYFELVRPAAPNADKPQSAQPSRRGASGTTE